MRSGREKRRVRWRGRGFVREKAKATYAQAQKTKAKKLLKRLETDQGDGRRWVSDQGGDKAGWEGKW